MLKVEDAVEFIRSRGQMKEWTNLQIENAIRKAIQNFALAYTCDDSGKLDGIVFGQWMDEGTTFHVTQIIGKIERFLKYLQEFHPQVKEITGNRSGKFSVYKIGKDL